MKLSVKLNLDHDLGNDHLQTWLSQLKIAFALHGVEDQKAQYLAAATNLGESGAHYLWQSYPTMPDGDAPFDKLESLFTEYFRGKRSKTSRLAALFTIGQQDGESIQAYRHRQQKEMRACDLTTAAYVDAVLDAMAVHLFGRGLSSSYTRQKVLESGENVTLAKVAESAQAITLAAQAVGEQRAGIEEAIASVSFAEWSSRPRGPVSQERGSAPSTCGYCGEIHVPGMPNCPATNAFCSKCGRRGHLGSVCRAGGQPEQRSYRFHSNRPSAAPSEIHSLEMQSPRYETFGVRAGKTGFTLPMRHIVIDGQHTIALRVDSVSMVTVLPKSMLPPGYQLQPPPCPLQPVGSQQITAVGVFEANLRYQAQETRETVFVVDDTHGTVPSLLVEQASIRLGLLAAPIASVELPSSAESLPSAEAALLVALQAARSTVNTVTGKAPGDLFLRGGYRTVLRQLSPVEYTRETDLDDADLDEEVRQADARAKAATKAMYNAQHRGQVKQLVPGQAVFVKQPSGATEKATVISATPHDATILTESGSQFRRHLDRLQPDPSEPSLQDPTSGSPTTSEAEALVGASDSGDLPDNPELRRSTRQRRPTPRYWRRDECGGEQLWGVRTFLFMIFS